MSKRRLLLVAAVALGLLAAAAGFLLRAGVIDVPIVASVPTLSLSQQTVRGGDVIELDVHGPSDYTWGLPTSLQQHRDGKWTTVYEWATWPGGAPYPSDPGPLKAFPFKERGGVPSIGFSGSASFMIEIPEVEPGDYRITLRFIKDGPETIEEREVIPAVQLIVVP